MIALVLFLVATSHARASSEATVLYAGYITKIRCEGKLLISAVGSPELLALEALPPQVGCGVLVKPLQKSGRTNLALETSTGSVNLLVEIGSAPRVVTSSQLDLKVKSHE